MTWYYFKIPNLDMQWNVLFFSKGFKSCVQKTNFWLKVDLAQFISEACTQFVLELLLFLFQKHKRIFTTSILDIHRYATSTFFSKIALAWFILLQ